MPSRLFFRFRDVGKRRPLQIKNPEFFRVFTFTIHYSFVQLPQSLTKKHKIIKSQDMCLTFYSYKFDILLSATKYARANKFAKPMSNSIIAH